MRGKMADQEREEGEAAEVLSWRTGGGLVLAAVLAGR